MYNQHTIFKKQFSNQHCFNVNILRVWFITRDESYRSTVDINSGVVSDVLVDGCRIVAHVCHVILKETTHFVLHLQENTGTHLAGGRRSFLTPHSGNME